jgi:hypothetical protein
MIVSEELQKEINLHGQSVAKIAELQAKSEEAYAEHMKRIAKITSDGFQVTVDDFKNALTPIQTAWDSQLRGLLAKTTTWKQAMKTIFEDLFLDLIKAIEAFFVKKAALMLAAAVAPDPAQLAATMKGIQTNLAQAYAGFAAFFAPFLGPAAPAAALAATAEVGATATSMAVAGQAEEGAWMIPSTSPWLLHRGETVLPAKAAETFRNMASGTSGGGGSIHIHAMDGASVLRVLTQHAGIVSRIVGGHMQANPSTHG